ncbi:MAG: replication-associated recombination protein A [Planctomycetota bacterium]
MSDLWAERRAAVQAKAAPLAARMRPRSLDEVAGQGHVLGEGKLLRRMLVADAIMSLILHGPPGTGKTTLARLIAEHTRRHFVAENAASVGVKRIREIIDDSARRVEGGGRGTILFLDEIHRFTRSQQDVLLGDVERGLVTLVGATTENPLFACNAALVSRSTLFRLEPLSEDDIVAVLRRAIEDEERGFGKRVIEASDEALRVWAIKSDGDARRALTALEVAVLSADAADERSESSGSVIRITRNVAEESIQQKAAVYADDEHYDTASAMIKSIRGNDPDAAVYWIARMLEGGEDPRFVVRRLAILASEDIGNADPQAAVLAASCWHLVERIGMPEARITLGQLATYLALAPKSNAAYVAIDEAMKDVREGRTIPVPVHLRDPNTSPSAGHTANDDGTAITMRDRREGDASARYRYSHNYDGGVTGQDYLGVERTYYEPRDSGAEAAMAERLREIKRLRDSKRTDS